MLIGSGLFDQAFYRASYADVARSGLDVFEHFVRIGLQEGRRPNFYFDPPWYLARYPEIRQAGMHPVLHYVTAGDAQGRQPSPLFDPGWYRARYGFGREVPALAHYLANRSNCRFAPIPEFDVDFYARENPDVVAAGVDPFEHFLVAGVREGRKPSAGFNAEYYTRRYLGGDRQQHPFLHFLAHKHEAGVYGQPPDDDASIPAEVRRYSRPSPDFEEVRPLPASAPRRAKVLAYYLPQFHACPENDAWWGKGFTEWTNVARGLPRFKGHYQPRVPRDLGFYNLEDPAVLRRQAEMAKGAGIAGFVFYFYWFNGKRLLDKPVNLFLDHGIDMPFCLLWANENWTRRWDGRDNEVLVAQDYHPQHDEELIQEFSRHFRDPRYIRVQGRPLLIVYRAGIIPDVARTLQRWRGIFRERFAQDPLLVMAQSFEDENAAAFGFDGAVEFPPHKLVRRVGAINAELEYLDLALESKVVSYDDMVRASLEEAPPPFPLIKTAVPGWDNDARRQGRGLSVARSTPAKYETWLSALVERARQTPFFGEPLVCVNAWNEWCEAAYLEPDVHYGAAYLNATARAISGVSRSAAGKRLLLIGHDAFRAGAQDLLLELGREWQERCGIEVAFVLLGGGAHEDEYRRVAPLTIATDEATLDACLKTSFERGYTSAVVNSCAAARVIPRLDAIGARTTLLVHELPGILRDKKLVAGARAGVAQAGNIVFPAAVVRDRTCAELGLPLDPRVHIVPTGMLRRIAAGLGAGGDAVRQELGIKPGERLVIGVGYADLRKGFDLFLQLWRIMRTLDAGGACHFCWVGDLDPEFALWLEREIAGAKASGSFHMHGYRGDLARFYDAADAFVLTSREDPFAQVALLAIAAGLPVFAFEGSGGIPELLRDYPLGRVIAFGDVPQMAATLAADLRTPSGEAEAAAGPELVRSRLDFPAYARRILELALPGLPDAATPASGR
ncbi:MAG: glycoside hydrolase family 99-like domain-containing protein [Nevskia sp.]|nr:glycoside hydrolase family 99-like domain-containing protein [Nevskia sp.]